MSTKKFLTVPQQLWEVVKDVYGLDEFLKVRDYGLDAPLQDKIGTIDLELLEKEDLSNKVQELSDSQDEYPSAHAVTQALLALPKPLRYIGDWDADQNIPELTDYEEGKEGYMYRVIEPGTQFELTFNYGDFLVYNANFEPEVWDMGDYSGKLDKVSSAGTYRRVYTVTAAGVQEMKDVVDTTTVNGSIVMRTGNGRINAANPSSGTEVCNVTFSDGRYYIKGTTLNQALQFGSNSTYGIQFYESNGYRVYVTYPSDGSWGGNMPDSPTSAINMYFRLANQSQNNNFIFKAGSSTNSMADQFMSIGNSGIRAARDIIVLNNPTYPSKLIFKNQGYGNKIGFEPEFVTPYGAGTNKLHLKAVRNNTPGADPALAYTIATFDDEGNTYFPTNTGNRFTVGSIDFTGSSIMNRDYDANSIYIGDDFMEISAPSGLYISTDNDNSKLAINGKTYAYHTFGQQYTSTDILPIPADGTADTYLVTGIGLATDEGLLGLNISNQTVYTTGGARHGTMIQISRIGSTIYMYNMGGTDPSALTVSTSTPLEVNSDYCKLIRLP